MGVVWHKVRRDLWRSKFRTVLIVLATAVGVFALGFVYGLSGVLTTRIAESHQASVPAHLTFFTSTFDQDVIDLIVREPGVLDAQGERVTTFRWKQPGEANWRDGVMIARADYLAQRMNLFELVDGEWPDESRTRHTVVVERILSGFLIVNVMNATITQQVWQIGVMKVIGATVGRVMGAYLAVALVYGLISLLLAVPAGALAAYLLAAVLLNLFNMTAGAFRLVPGAVGIQIGVGLIVPLLAALVPVIGGARITAYQAISDYGLGAGFGHGWFDRLIGRIGVAHSGARFGFPRPLVLSLRNTFRRKARIALTLITLVCGGAMFIVVMSVSATMNNTLEVLLDELGFDALIAFSRAYRVVPLVDVAENVPGVTRAEVWDQRAAQLVLTDRGDEQRDNYVPFGALTRETGNVHRGGLVVVMSDRRDTDLIPALREAYTARHMEPVQILSAQEVRQSNRMVFDAITYLMLAMAVLAAVVGSIGLMSTMSINVVERGREIGVMRAVGATSLAILGIFVSEGILIGVLSWLLAVPLSYPGARLFSNLVSNTLFNVPLDFQYSLVGMIFWLMIVVVLSASASLLPALRATQVSVRETLAYE